MRLMADGLLGEGGLSGGVVWLMPDGLFLSFFLPWSCAAT